MQFERARSSSRETAAARLRELAALLDETRDVIAGRVDGPEPPEWARARGLAEPLLALDDEALARCEAEGPEQALASTPGVPAALAALAERARAATTLERLDGVTATRPLRSASETKRAQIAALGALVRAWLPRVERVVDLGAGRGHLTRELAEALDVEALGIERGAVAARARALSDDPRVRFEHRDALDAPVPANARTLLVGLHACGALGDALIARAAASGAAVLFVGCCPQKVAGESRAPLSATGRARDLWLPRARLGLANAAALGQSDDGIARRERRYALFLLLREAGVALAPGDEARGISRRQFRHPLPRVVAHVFARRGLPAPSAAAIDAAEARARIAHGRMRRLALPRTMLARAIELAIAFDRAAALEERADAPAARVIEAFDRAASPRNVAILRAPAR